MLFLHCLIPFDRLLCVLLLPTCIRLTYDVPLWGLPCVWLAEMARHQLLFINQPRSQGVARGQSAPLNLKFPPKYPFPLKTLLYRVVQKKYPLRKRLKNGVHIVNIKSWYIVGFVFLLALDWNSFKVIGHDLRWPCNVFSVTSIFNFTENEVVRKFFLSLYVWRWP